MIMIILLIDIINFIITKSSIVIIVLIIIYIYHYDYHFHYFNDKNYYNFNHHDNHDYVNIDKTVEIKSMNQNK